MSHISGLLALAGTRASCQACAAGGMLSTLRAGQAQRQLWPDASPEVLGNSKGSLRGLLQTQDQTHRDRLPMDTSMWASCPDPTASKCLCAAKTARGQGSACCGRGIPYAAFNLPSFYHCLIKLHLVYHPQAYWPTKEDLICPNWPKESHENFFPYSHILIFIFLISMRIFFHNLPNKSVFESP